MAQFCARVRKRPDLPAVSIKDVYRYPTITLLSAALAPRTRDAAPPTAGPVAVPDDEPAPASTTRYVVCGLLQVLVIVGYASLAAVVVDRGLQWIWAGEGLLDTYVRAAVVGTAGFLAACVVPVVVKWVVIGRWTRRRIRIWSIGYVRFWAVQDHDHAQPDGALRRDAAVHRLPPVARRDDRARAS